jgi:hypothetical protein
MIGLKSILDDFRLYEADDDKYVSIGFGRFKLKGKEDDDDADVYVKTDSGKYEKSADQSSDDKDAKDDNKPSPKKAMSIDKSGGFGDDNEESDDVEISDANSGPIDRDDIMDMLKNDSEIVDKMGDDVYWDGMDLVSSKFDDATIASIDDDSNMTLGDLKKQIMDFEGEEDDEPTHEEIMQYIEDEGDGGDAIGPDGNPTPEAYEDAKQELMYQKQNETKVINGKKYRAIKEEKKSKKHKLQETYERIANRMVT